jgi:glycosyltransferase involved in cell wall biosynthesis
LPANLPLRLRIAGDGSERGSLEHQAAALGIGAKVDFLGHQDDLPAFYQSLDIVVLTSSTEQMPLCVLEAMACGLPVVSTDVGDVRNMVSAANKPFVIPTGGLAQALLVLARDAMLRKILGRDNRCRCAKMYALEVMFRRYSELYSDVGALREERRGNH